MYKTVSAGITDLDAIMEMQVAHRVEVKNSPLLEFNFDKASKYTLGVLMETNDNEVIIKCINDDGLILGYIWLAIVQPHFTDRLVLIEKATYIKPEYRSGKVLLLLLKEAKGVSKYFGCAYFQFGCMSGIDKASDAYDKRFYKLGSTYIHY